MALWSIIKPGWWLVALLSNPEWIITENFSPVIKPTAVRTVLNIAVSRSYPIHQLDVTNAYSLNHSTASSLPGCGSRSA